MKLNSIRHVSGLKQTSTAALLAAILLSAGCNSDSNSTAESAADFQSIATETTNPVDSEAAQDVAVRKSELAAPQGLKVSSAQGVNRLTWAPVAGATSYMVFLYDHNGVESHTTVHSAEFSHLDGSDSFDWRYEVVARSSEGFYSTRSNAFIFNSDSISRTSDVGL